MKNACYGCIRSLGLVYNCIMLLVRVLLFVPIFPCMLLTTLLTSDTWLETAEKINNILYKTLDAIVNVYMYIIRFITPMSRTFVHKLTKKLK